MRTSRQKLGLLSVLLAVTILNTASAQPFAQPEKKSPGKAFALSVVLPGLGHRYVHNGSWKGAATWLALSDLSSIAGYAATDWRHGQRVENYEGLAVAGAGADISGKDRTFFLNLASYTSSDEFIEVSLRNRAWDQIGYIEDASFEWEWASTEDFSRYRSERNRAESLSRRRSLLAAVMIGNRIVSGITSALQARSGNQRIALGLTTFRQDKTRVGGQLRINLSR